MHPRWMSFVGPLRRSAMTGRRATVVGGCSAYPEEKESQHHHHSQRRFERTHRLCETLRFLDPSPEGGP